MIGVCLSTKEQTSNLNLATSLHKKDMLGTWASLSHLWILKLSIYPYISLVNQFIVVIILDSTCAYDDSKVVHT